MRQIGKGWLLFLIIVIATSCVTQKRKEDLSGLGKLYHNTTAKFNGYFNANEILQESIVKLEEQHQDNFNKILPTYKYVAAGNPKAVASELDEAIKKVSIVVSLHRQSHWTDDCYLLLGNAQYLKQDYEAAEATFRYMVNEFDPEKLKKKKPVKKSDKKLKKKKTSSSSKKKKGGSSAKSSKDRQKAAKAAAKKRKAYNKQVKKGKKPTTSKSSKSKKETTEKTEVVKPSGKKDSKKKVSKKEAKKAKKEAEEPTEEPDNYFLKHRPVYQDAKLWLARTLIERRDYEGAQRYLNQLEADPKTLEVIKGEIAAARAHLFLKQKAYNTAVAPLKQAVKDAPKRKQKARYAYILAQIYQRQSKEALAMETFEQVLKYGPDYDMNFSARLNMAQNAYLSGQESEAEARKALEKMLKDIKNEDFRDQIYYTLAQIDLKNGDKPAAIENLKLSLKYSVNNNAQKAESYLQLADMYFEVEDFVPAKNYYDSTLQVLNKTDERYETVQRFSLNLTDIAKNLMIIELQDSLLRISALSDEDKRTLAYEMKKKADEERRQAALNSQNPGNDKNQGRQNFRSPALSKESSFFAYDEKVVKRGKRDFEKKWGSRALEDDWRRSNRRNAGIFEDEIIEDEVPPETVFTDEDVDKFLKDVPGSDEELAAAHLKIREAMFALGSLYRERLENNEKAVEVLEEMNARYPGSTLELDSWYFLYLAFLDLENQPKAKEYYNKIIEKYPSSTYALVLQDPNYLNTLQNEERKLNTYYDEAYIAFTTGKYQEAYSKSVGAKEKFGAANTLQPKFALLAAMCTGSLKGKDAYIQELNSVVAKYPETPEQSQAKEMLRLLGARTGKVIGDQKVQETAFKVDENKLHYMIVAFDQDVKLNDQKVVVSNYNLKYHKLDKLRISNIYLGSTTKDRSPVIVIRRFKNKAEAMKYYDGVQKNGSDFIDAAIKFNLYPITQDNYRQVLKAKSLDGYDAFFQENYLR